MAATQGNRNRTVNHPADSKIPKIFSYGQLAQAASHYQRDFGDGTGKVYRAKLGTGREVTIKRLDSFGQLSEQDFSAEARRLCLLMSHPNVVNIIGYCARDNQGFVVSEYMPQGSLEYRLHGLKLHLDWNARMVIASGIATGLNFLHNQSVIHGDLKSSNVLLGQDLVPKLSDFGLANFSLGVDADRYSAPEYIITGRPTAMSDIYSFGVVLLELITGTQLKRTGLYYIIDWKRHLSSGVLGAADKGLGRQFPRAALSGVGELALDCLHNDPSARPHTRYVMEKMNFFSSIKCDGGGLGTGDADRSFTGRGKEEGLENAALELGDEGLEEQVKYCLDFM